MKNTATNKRRHLSLADQVNLLIILITLGVSLLMVAINAINYNKSIICNII